MNKLLISFDFDGTISGVESHVQHICQMLKNHILLGDEVIVLTARDPAHDDPAWYEINCPKRIVLNPYMERLGLTHLKVFYTNHQLKGPFAAKLGVSIHYDNDPNEIWSCRQHGVTAIPVGNEQHDPKLHKSYYRRIVDSLKDVPDLNINL